MLREMLEVNLIAELPAGELERVEAVEREERETLIRLSVFLDLQSQYGQSQYGGDFTLTDDDGDLWVVNGEGKVAVP